MSKLLQVSKGRTPEDFLLKCSSSTKTTKPLSSQKFKNPSVSSNPFTVLGTLPSLSKTSTTNYKNVLKPDTVPGSGKFPEINNRKIHYVPKNTVIHVAEFEDEWAQKRLSRIFPPFSKDDDPFNFLDRKYQIPFQNGFNLGGSILELLKTFFQAVSLKVLTSSKIKESISHTLENLLFQYFRTFKVAWIFCWDFEIFPTSTDSFSFQHIVRRCKIKWWEKFNDSNACSKAVKSWIDQQIKVKTGTSSSQIDFLTEKSKIMAQLAQCSDPEIFAVLSQKAASMAKAESSRGSVAASEVGSDPDPNFEDDNKDDCLGVDEDFFAI
ncbi:Uncharacterized protein Adt_41818 [Abeliophyllum distichum]|uniref:Uncharacterized protein n=1 Tax=Abeliophyllum distichum TaxID=126358 RepID=A0ABD1PQS1_9LAMI